MDKHGAGVDGGLRRDPRVSRSTLAAAVQRAAARALARGARESGPAGADVACEQYHRVERGHGRFSRTFDVPF